MHIDNCRRAIEYRTALKALALARHVLKMTPLAAHGGLFVGSLFRVKLDFGFRIGLVEFTG